MPEVEQIMSFDELLTELLRHEGGYSNHSADRGGATNFGITQTVFSEWLAQQKQGWRDVRTLTKDEVARIYFSQYWLPAKCADIPPGLRGVHFDTAVNHGVGRAARLLQEAVGVTADGVIGPKTKEALAASDTELVKARYVNLRYRFYGRIIQRDRSQLAFITGWMTRMELFH